MSATSLVYYNDQWGKVQPRIHRIQYKITGAVTASPIIAHSGSIITFGAIASQSVIDNFLGTSSEFDYLAFDATALGADAVAFIINMGGQAKTAVFMRARCYSGTGGGTVVERGVQGGSLTNSTLETAFACGANGNLACKVDFGNTPDFDALTSGVIDIELHWISK